MSLDRVVFDMARTNPLKLLQNADGILRVWEAAGWEFLETTKEKNPAARAYLRDEYQSRAVMKYFSSLPVAHREHER